MGLVASERERFSGRALYDEEVLSELGVNDFARYACVPGATPPPLCREMVE
ncbi:MAG: hypothetical protein QM765_19660 [Myxococcales bacterium]